ncbi:MAG: hypothetical protein WCO84_01285 [bacterium]
MLEVIKFRMTDFNSKVICFGDEPLSEMNKEVIGNNTYYINNKGEVQCVVLYNYDKRKLEKVEIKCF